MNVELQHFVRRLVVVRPAGRVDAFTVDELKQTLTTALDGGLTELVVDLQAVDFLDSAGMAVLVSALKRARGEGGDVRLIWPVSEGARRILRLTRFDRVFEMLDADWSPTAAGLQVEA